MTDANHIRKSATRLKSAINEMLALQQQAAEIDFLSTDSYWTTCGDPDAEPLHVEHMRLLKQVEASARSVKIMLKAMHQMVHGVEMKNYEIRAEVEHEAAMMECPEFGDPVIYELPDDARMTGGFES